MAERFLVLIALLMLGWYIAGCSSSDPPFRASGVLLGQSPVASEAQIIANSGQAFLSNATAMTKSVADVTLVNAVKEIYITKALYTVITSSSEPAELTPAMLWATNNRIPGYEVIVVIIPASQQSGNLKRMANNLTAMVQEVPIVVIKPTFVSEAQCSRIHLAESTVMMTSRNYSTGVTYELIMPMNTVILSHHGPVNPPVASSHNTVSNCQAATDMMLGSNAIAG